MKVLIIEDDPTLSQNIKDALLEEEIFSDTVFDGVLAERLLKNQLYDAVILDVNLPGKTGYEICKSFREFNTNTPVIMLTAFSELDDKIEGFKAKKHIENLSEISLEDAFGSENVKDSEENQIKIEKKQSKYSWIPNPISGIKSIANAFKDVDLSQVEVYKIAEFELEGTYITKIEDLDFSSDGSGAKEFSIELECEKIKSNYKREQLA